MELTATDSLAVGQLQELHQKYGGLHLALTVQLPDTLDAIRDVLKTKLWPEAVPASMIVRDDQGKKIRAMSVISSFIREPIVGKKFLDFGCEEGHCVVEATKQGAQALGYDIARQVDWPSNCTDKLADVDAAGPYNVILAYDVLDHITDPMVRFDMLKRMRKWLAPGGTIYVRCHPYTARHGTHLYYRLNKAYAHLFLPADEQDGGLPTDPIVAPIANYTKWFEDSGLIIAKQTFTRQDMEPFFSGFRTILFKRLEGNVYVKDLKTLNAVLGIQFADYELK